MELEGQWWRGHQALRYKELKLPSYKGQSIPSTASQKQSIASPSALLPDILLSICWTFMDRYDLSIQQLHLLEQLNSLGCMTNMNLVLTEQNLLHVELLLLETFQWNFCLPTAAHFMEYYLSGTELHDGWPMIYYFLEVSLQAAACVASSRIILRPSPTWLTRATSYCLLLGLFMSCSRPPSPHCPHQTHHTSLQHRPPVAEGHSCQQIGSTTHTSPDTLDTLQTRPAGFQASVQGLGRYLQTGVGMSLEIPVQVKPCPNVSYNQSYQLNEHYPCITPCFERWFYVKVIPDLDCSGT
ncbi:unnamed protein product [Nyctereutes procyonoides]|uniref:(raccoon dog) hypothetical protein n=1 Tax=Nyctereutes procyonoides TaxID=34880 RepID=A0A811XSZ7_NYCPR|nr:unnamed protein product [Nyctereutes procyonoides]